MKKRILVLLVSMASISLANFKFEGVGARSLGMGGAFTGIADDASCLYYNPAGILKISDREEMYMYSQKLNELTYQYVGLVWKNTGFSYINQSGNLTKAENQWGDKAGESVYTMSYAGRINGGVKCGTSLKIFQYSNERASDASFGFDIGILYSPEIKEDINFGLCIRNLFAEIQGINLDKTIIGGIALRWNPKEFWKGLRSSGFNEGYCKGFRRKTLLFSDENMPVLMSLDLYNRKDDKNKNRFGWALGGEYKAFNIILFRLGLNNGDIRGGIGLAHDKWRLDYAYGVEKKEWIDPVDNHYISLSMNF
ncbi:TPA: hypothetical protein DCX16_03300 [bacterium]|nr:hypothetical protein [bacterium]